MRKAPNLMLAAMLVGGCTSTGSTPSAPALAAAAASPSPTTMLMADHAVMAPIPNPPEPTKPQSARAVRPPREAADPATRVAQANAAARMQPTRAAYANARQIYGFEDGALFQVYASPGRITDIVLQDGEALSGTGPVAAGDTSRWVIGDTESGAGATHRVHILVKPTQPGLETNLVINTDRRTYHLELRATKATYMAEVSWRYPDDVRRAQATDPARFAVPVAPVEALNFSYRISGDHPRWRPVIVYDDGRQTVVEFASTIGQSDLPPLFVTGPDGRIGDIVNYRVSGQRIVVDRLFDKAELRLGDKRGAQRVRIERIGRSS